MNQSLAAATMAQNDEGHSDSRGEWLAHLRDSGGSEIGNAAASAFLPGDPAREEWIRHLQGGNTNVKRHAKGVLFADQTSAPPAGVRNTVRSGNPNNGMASLPPVAQTTRTGLSQASQIRGKVSHKGEVVAGIRRPTAANQRWGTMKVAMRLKKAPVKKRQLQKELPRGVDLAIPGIHNAWEWFQTMDTDNSQSLALTEVVALLTALGLDLTKREMKKVFREMTEMAPFAAVPEDRMEVDFMTFAKWWSRHQAIARRDMRRTVRELFQKFDTDDSGVLDKDEFFNLVDVANADPSLPSIGLLGTPNLPKFGGVSDSVANKMEEGGGSMLQEAEDGRLSTPSGSLKTRSGVTYAVSTGSSGSKTGAKLPVDGPASKISDQESQFFDRENAWKEIRKVPFDEGRQLGVNFAAFESWWKTKAGLSDPDIPVLPEFLVMRIDDKVRASKSWDSVLRMRGVVTDPGAAKRSKNWTVLKEKLMALVRMRGQWGDLHHIYETRGESMYYEQKLGPWIRDPDSTFSVCWDFASVSMLMYVTFTVPLRSSFGVVVPLWSAGFFVDLAVDLFFIADVIINFRTSFYDRNGFRETRAGKIAKNYFQGWFLIDAFSCIPFGYIQYMIPSESGTSGNGSSYKGLKALRLMKMTKMLRLSRIKGILARYGSDANYQQYFSFGFTVFFILFLGHMLACGFYLVGEVEETLANGKTIIPWVKSENEWLLDQTVSAIANTTTTSVEVDPVIQLGTRYTASLYYVLNALESGYTTYERAYGVFAELVRDIILGLVASLITTISLSMATTDNDTNFKIKRLRTWLQDKKLPKGFRVRCMQHFTELWTNHSKVELSEILEQSPPAMASNLADMLFGRFLSTIPLFIGLSPDVISALCLRCKPMIALSGHTIIQEGEPGKEMYMLMQGEVEVCERRFKDQSEAKEEVRLGFLSEGAFFGEAPVLGGQDEIGVELRTRTVRAVTDSELCYLTKESVHQLYDAYPELKARMARFGQTGRVLTDKNLSKLELSRTELADMSQDFQRKTKLADRMRKEKNLHSNSFVPLNYLEVDTMLLKARSRFKDLITKRRVKEEEMARISNELKAQERKKGHVSHEDFGSLDAQVTIGKLREELSQMKIEFSSQQLEHQAATTEQILEMQTMFAKESQKQAAQIAQLVALLTQGGVGQSGKLPRQGMGAVDTDHSAGATPVEATPFEKEGILDEELQSVEEILARDIMGDEGDEGDGGDGEDVAVTSTIQVLPSLSTKRSTTSFLARGASRDGLGNGVVGATDVSGSISSSSLGLPGHESSHPGRHITGDLLVLDAVRDIDGGSGGDAEGEQEGR